MIPTMVGTSQTMVGGVPTEEKMVPTMVGTSPTLSKMSFGRKKDKVLSKSLARKTRAM